MEQSIKTRPAHRDIKVLDKTVTATEHMKSAYIRTRNSAEQTQAGEQTNPIEYAEDQIMQKGENAARGTAYEAGRQGRKLADTVRERHRRGKEVEQFREDIPEPSTSLSSAGGESAYQPKEQMRNRGAVQSHTSVSGGQSTQGKAGKSKSAPSREMSGQAIKTVDKGERTVKTAHASVKTSGKTAVKGAGRTIKTAGQANHTVIKTTEASARAAQQGAKTAAVAAQRTALAAKQAAIATAQAAKATAKAGAAAVKAAIAATKALVTAIFAGGWIAVLILLIVVLFGALFAAVGGSNSNTVTPVSAEVQAYEPLIRQYARQYGIEEYVELIKAVMMQESGWQGSDPMQASECGYNTRYPHTPNAITDPEYSIDVGIQNLKACLEAAEVENPVDMNNIKLALQGYNYGNGYISWAKENYGGYTYANAVEFSDMMAQRNGWSSYGDKEYVSHVLRYYVFGRIPTGTGSQAIVQVALTQEGNTGGQPYWSWYGFSQREEWCACFVSWCANQCGYIDSGVIPKFAKCTEGANWFQQRGQWQDASYTPQAGDIIFFLWAGDSETGHVGIVESVVDGTVYTVEGNSGDKVQRNSYPIGYGQIYGYGIVRY